MRPFDRKPKVHFGPTGRNLTNLKPIVRDEIGDLQLSVSIDTLGKTRIDFGKPVTYIALSPDKAYDFAHLVLEHVKDKQGGEPVNVTEEKIIAALEHALVCCGLFGEPKDSPHEIASKMLPYFMQSMAGGETACSEYVAPTGGDSEAENIAADMSCKNCNLPRSKHT